MAAIPLFMGNMHFVAFDLAERIGHLARRIGIQLERWMEYQTTGYEQSDATRSDANTHAD